MTSAAIAQTSFARPVAARASTRASAAAPSLWALLSQALEMAHAVGETAPFSRRGLQRVRELAIQA